MVKLKRKTQKKVIEIIDSLLEIRYLDNLGKLVYGFLFLLLFIFAGTGYLKGLGDGYFELVVLFAIAIFALYKADTQLSNLDGILFPIGILMMVGAILTVIGVGWELS